MVVICQERHYSLLDQIMILQLLIVFIDLKR